MTYTLANWLQFRINAAIQVDRLLLSLTDAYPSWEFNILWAFFPIVQDWESCTVPQMVLNLAGAGGPEAAILATRVHRVSRAIHPF